MAISAIATICEFNLARLEQIALTGAAGAARTRFGRGGRTFRCRIVFGARADAAVGKFNLERHARRDRRGRPQGPPFAIAHQSKPARQHASIREGREKLAAALGTRGTCRNELAHGASGAFAEGRHPSAILPDTVAMNGQVGGDAGAQS
jgi:hypothetical protein